MHIVNKCIITDIDLIINIFIALEMTTRNRQISLRNLHNDKKYLTFSPQKLLPSISEHKQIKKNTAKQLTHTISKFNSLNKRQEQRFSEDLLRSSINVLKAFSNIENNFQELFHDLFGVFRRFTFAVEDPDILALLSNYRVKQGCSMRKTCFLMNDQLEFIMRNKNDCISELQSKYSHISQKYEIELAKWIQERKFLVAEVDRCKKLSNIQYAKSLENTIEELKSKINELETQIKYMTKDNQQLAKSIDHNQNTIHDLDFQNGKLKSDIYDLTIRQQKIEKYFSSLRDRFDQLLTKMMGIKQSIAKVQEENDVLVSQRANLVNRAAVGFQELTPRPKYKDIFGISMKNHINSTKDIFANIVENSGMDYKDIVKKIILKKHNYKLEETEAIRQQVVGDIIKAKEQMSKI